MLIAPLDWGLGHATRCIPLIENFLKAGFKVIIAAEGDQKILLQQVFPEIEMLHLQGYRLKYGSTKLRTIVKIIFQVPKILTAINLENKWLQQLVTDKHLDIVIADNRFGLHHKKLLSVFITHQLQIKTSLGNFTDACIRRLNYSFINRFNYCWIPDYSGGNNLAGELSHPDVLPRVRLNYIGLLSRVEKQELPVAHRILVLLSGPEPQRTLLEQLLVRQLIDNGCRAVVARGLPGVADELPPNPLLTVYDCLAGAELQKVINQSEIVISRSGYSTVMDLLPLQKKCIFIPTPGQAEQEYLAAYLSSRKLACMSAQGSFSLPFMLDKIEKTSLEVFNPVGKEADSLVSLISELMSIKVKAR